jgi:hypothetical protein
MPPLYLTRNKPYIHRPDPHRPAGHRKDCYLDSCGASEERRQEKCNQLAVPGNQAGTRRRYDVGLPAQKECSRQATAVLDRHVNWGVANPAQRKVPAQLQVSDILTKDSREAGGAPFVEMQTIIRDAIEQRDFRDDLPAELVSKSLGALAEATMDDPVRVAQVVLRLAASDQLPAHLLLGCDAVHHADQAEASRAADLERWRETSVSTDFDVS